MSHVPRARPRLRLGGGDLRLPDRGRGGRGRPRTVHLGHVLPGTRRDRQRRHRRRGLRPLPPLARGHRPDAAARAGRLPVLDRVAPDPAGRRRPGQPGRAGLLRPAGRRAARRPASGPSRPCTTGICRRRCRTAAAGRTATPPTASPSTPAVVAARLGDRVADWFTAQRAAVLGLDRPPGRQDGARAARDIALAVPASHHLLLGHGLAAAALRATRRRHARVGAVHQPQPVRAGRPTGEATRPPPGAPTATPTAGGWIRCTAADTRPT